MKAIVYREFGSADVLKLEDVEKPVPQDDEVLIRVRAASINPLDWRLMHGKPRLVGVMARLMKMPVGRPGVDLAGEVEAVGENVTQFKPGDEVFGGGRRACSEYACSPEKSIVRKPESVTFEQAASVNVAGLTALQGLRDKGKIQSGQKVLINGAAGGVGTFAVQIAKSFGAHVTGVCSTRNLELVKSIGADAVIDYTKEDFVTLPERYDLILDCVGNKSLAECRSVLTPKGRHVIVGAGKTPSLIHILAPVLGALITSPFLSRKAITFIAKSSQPDLILLGEMTATGKLKPVIEQRYSLSDVPAAMRHAEQGHTRGKLVIDIG